MHSDDDCDGAAARPASSPCQLHELGPDGAPRVDPVQARDVARWRTVERERLIGARLALAAPWRAAQSALIAAQADGLVRDVGAPLVGLYWPLRGEPDLRSWMAALHARGVGVALPGVVVRHQPLQYRAWQPDARLGRDAARIPWPADGAVVTPTVVVIPVVGFDAGCYRLGYGSGYVDRTLAALAPRPFAIGVGYPGAAIATIFPQPHDIPMDVVATGEGPPLRRT